MVRAPGGVRSNLVRSHSAAGELRLGVDAEQTHAAGGQDALLGVLHGGLPHLRGAAAVDRARADPHPAGTGGTHEAGVVLQADHRLAAGRGDQRGADRGDRLDGAGVNAAVHDPERLQVFGADLDLGDDLVGGGADELHAHGGGPVGGALVHAVELGGDVTRGVEVHGRSVAQLRRFRTGDEL